MINQQDEPPHKQWLAILILVLGILFFPVQMDKAVGIALDEQNAYLQPYSPIRVIKSSTLASLATEDLFEGLVYKTLIRCLAKYESGFNQNARGADGEIGILQFKPTTFDAYCQGSIYSAEDQIQCCDRMLLADWNNRFHWTTIGFCLTN